MPVDVGLASTSNHLLGVALVLYAVAMIGFAADFAYGRRAPEVEAEAEAEAGSGNRFGRAAVVLTTVGLAAHVASVVARGLAAHRVPWGNMYEFSSMICLVAVAAFLVLLTRQPVRHLGAFVLVPVELYLGLAATVLYVPAAPLVPALSSYWIKIHVVAAITASGIFMVGATMTALYLVKQRFEDQHGGPVLSPGPGATAAIAVGARSGSLMRRLPTAEALDRLQYRTIAFAFPIWTFAVIAGAIWAEAAWGRYWGWDPKETWSLVTWLAYAGYLHARATAGWKGRKAAALSLVAFTALLFDFIGVNIWIAGLHSYGGV